MTDNTGDVMKKVKEAFHQLPIGSDKGLEQINDLAARISELENKANRVDQQIALSENRSDRVSSFVIFIVGGIAVAFFLTLIPIALDYWKYNEDRFEKNMTEIHNVETRFSERYPTKEQLKSYADKTDEVSKVITCIRNKGLFSISCF